MYSLLESKAEIASAQRKLEATIRKSFKGKATTNIGYPGGTERGAQVVTDGRYPAHTHRPNFRMNRRRGQSKKASGWHSSSRPEG